MWEATSAGGHASAAGNAIVIEGYFASMSDCIS